MKKLTLTAMLLAALVGCQKTEMIDSSNGLSSLAELVFTADGNKVTKTAPDKDATDWNTDEEDNTDDFGVFAYTHTAAWEDTDYASEVAQYSNKQVTYNNGSGTVSYAWRPVGGTSYWPVDQNVMLSTYAYTPYYDSTLSGVQVVTASVVDQSSMKISSYDNTNGATNLMTAMAFDATRTYNSSGYVTSGNSIALKFHRALSQVRFNLHLVDGSESGTTMVSVANITTNTGNVFDSKQGIYTTGSSADVLPALAADIKADGAAKVYAGADVYVQSIKLCNIPYTGDATMTLANGAITTSWTSDGNLMDYVVYANSDYSSSLDDITEDDMITGSYNKIQTEATFTALRKGGLVSTLVEGAGDDDFGDTDAMNPFQRFLLISPFIPGNNTAGVNQKYITYSDSNGSVADSDALPYIEFTFFVDVNAESGATTFNNELAVIRKPFYYNLAPNTRVTYNVALELSELTFTPTIEEFEADITVDELDASNSTDDHDNLLSAVE